jgi:Icc-related predicted phosphoesterase
VCPGNDDHFAISEIINESECVKNTEGLVVRIDDHHEMISTGWTNPTPWKTYKECSEEELSKKIEELVSQVENISNCIFNFHAPPYGSGLDLAPKIDESLKQDSRILIPVGSQAVRASIEKYQPLLGLHGHIHEGKGFTYIGRTLCVNPGSSYERGVLLGVLINIDSKSIKSYLPVVG